MTVVGEWEQPINVARNRAGSIHDDEAARRLGFRGGYVSARTHLNVFVPLLGTSWFEHGALSLRCGCSGAAFGRIEAVCDVPMGHQVPRRCGYASTNAPDSRSPKRASESSSPR